MFLEVRTDSQFLCDYSYVFVKETKDYNGVFCLVAIPVFEKEEMYYEYFAGIGVYGYDDNDNWVGTSPYVEDFKQWVAELFEDKYYLKEDDGWYQKLMSFTMPIDS